MQKRQCGLTPVHHAKMPLRQSRFEVTAFTRKTQYYTAARQGFDHDLIVIRQTQQTLAHVAR